MLPSICSPAQEYLGPFVKNVMVCTMIRVAAKSAFGPRCVLEVGTPLCFCANEVCHAMPCVIFLIVMHGVLCRGAECDPFLRLSFRGWVLLAPDLNFVSPYPMLDGA